MNRKERRALEKQMKKQGTSEDEMAEKMFLFDKLPDECSACTKWFDKKNRDMVFSWNVVVKQEVVRLFCPECIEKTKEVIKNYEHNKETEQDSTDSNTNA